MMPRPSIRPNRSSPKRQKRSKALLLNMRRPLKGIPIPSPPSRSRPTSSRRIFPRPRIRSMVSLTGRVHWNRILAVSSRVSVAPIFPRPMPSRTLWMPSTGCRSVGPTCCWIPVRSAPPIRTTCPRPSSRLTMPHRMIPITSSPTAVSRIP